MARFYGLVVVPRGSHKPRDGAKVESRVQIVEREVLARLRDRTFSSLSELIRAMCALLQSACLNVLYYPVVYSRRKHISS